MTPGGALLAYSTLECGAVTAGYRAGKPAESQLPIGKLRAILEATKGYAYSLCPLPLGRIASNIPFYPGATK